MRKDFSKIYGGVGHFGLWAEESADAHGAKDALAILAAAVDRTQDEDLRYDRDTLDALAFLIELAGGLPAADVFRAALDVSHPVTRRRQIKDAHRALLRASAWTG